MDLPSLRSIPFFAGESISVQEWTRPHAIASLLAEAAGLVFWHGTDIRTDNETDKVKHNAPAAGVACEGIGKETLIPESVRASCAVGEDA